MGSSHSLSSELALSSPTALLGNIAALSLDDVIMTHQNWFFSSGADVKQLHAAHLDEIAKVIMTTTLNDPRYMYCLPGKVSGTVDAELCLYTATHLVKFAFESHGSVWGHCKARNQITSSLSLQG